MDLHGEPWSITSLPDDSARVLVGGAVLSNSVSLFLCQWCWHAGHVTKQLNGWDLAGRRFCKALGFNDKFQSMNDIGSNYQASPLVHSSCMQQEGWAGRACPGGELW